MGCPQPAGGKRSFKIDLLLKLFEFLVLRALQVVLKQILAACKKHDMKQAVCMLGRVCLYHSGNRHASISHVDELTC